MRVRRTSLVAPLIALVALALAAFVHGSGAQTRSGAENSIRQRRADLAEPSPTPPAKIEETLPSDEVLRVETNLTNVFFTAADKNKRFVGTLKREDVRVLE